MRKKEIISFNAIFSESYENDKFLHAIKHLFYKSAIFNAVGTRCSQIMLYIAVSLNAFM